MCEVFDQISDVRGLDGSVFIYGDYSTCHIVLQRMVTYKMEGPAKTVMLEKLGLVTWIKISIFPTAKLSLVVVNMPLIRVDLF